MVGMHLLDQRGVYMSQDVVEEPRAEYPEKSVRVIVPSIAKFNSSRLVCDN
jgi:hypothetical protein